VSAIGQTARSRPIKWAPTGKPTAPSGDPVSVSIRLWPRLQRGLFFGGSRLGQCFTVPKAPMTLSPHLLPISAEVSLGFRKCRRPVTMPVRSGANITIDQPHRLSGGALADRSRTKR
jgi:hypothetical protein